jgi:transposase
VIPRIENRHRSREFIAFMNQLLGTYPEGEIHVILDNTIIHRSKEVQAWHKKPNHQRVVFHFIPTYSSWLNLIEVLFNLVQAKVLRRGTFPSKETLVQKLLEYIDQFNQEGKVFQWTKPAEAIFRSLNCPTGH